MNDHNLAEKIASVPDDLREPVLGEAIVQAMISGHTLCRTQVGDTTYYSIKPKAPTMKLRDIIQETGLTRHQIRTRWQDTGELRPVPGSQRVYSRADVQRLWERDKRKIGKGRL